MYALFLKWSIRLVRTRRPLSSDVREDRLGAITVLIMEQPLCASCISTKASVATGELPRYLGWIDRLFPVQDQIERCRACDALTMVVQAPLIRSSAKCQPRAWRHMSRHFS
jgi:hypothetical protein